jgi:PAS domain S-box-containing protein
VKDEPSLAVRLVDVADDVPALVALIDAEGRYEFNNAVFEQWFGRPRHELRGRRLREVLGEAAFQTLRPHLAEALGGRASRFEAWITYREDVRRYVLGSYVPWRRPDGTVGGVVAFILDRTEARGYRFLVEAGEVLASSVHYEATVAAAVRLAVPELADWSGVDLLEGGELRRLAIAACEPDDERLGWELTRRYPVDLAEDEGIAKVLRTGQPLLYAKITDEVLQASAQDEEHLRILRALGFRSAIFAPLNARGRTLGVLWFATSRSRRQYGGFDLELAQRLAESAAVAVDNARLYEAARAGHK